MAGRIPQAFLDQLLSRVDLVEVIDSRVPLRKAGRNFVACCPFHNEKTPSFSVSPEKQFYHCFGCGVHGTAIGFLMEYERLEFPDAVEELARSVGLEIPREAGAAPRSHGDLRALVEQADRFFRYQLREHSARQKAVDYLRNRGLDGETVKIFGIGYAPPGWDSLLQAMLAKGVNRKDLIAAGLAVEKDGGGGAYDRFRDRIIFPIRDRRGRTIAFGGRVLGDATPKYLNSPETPFFRKGQELYGLYEARRSEPRLQRLLVVEGYMDVVALAQHGIRYAVATLGTATTSEHLERLFRVAPGVIFCFDGDRAGREAAWRALENALSLLRDGRQAGFLFLPDEEDPDSLVHKEGHQAFEQRLAQAVPLSDYLFEHLQSQMLAGDVRARLAELAFPLLSKIPDGMFRSIMIERLSSKAGVGEARIEKRLTAPSRLAAPDGRLATPGGSEINLTRTPVRKAIALLLYRIDLAQKAGDMSRFKGIPTPGLDLLVELVELMQSNTHINTAALLERYRGSEAGTVLERLAQWQPEIPETLFKFEAEFLDTLENLKKRHSLQQQLLDKAARGTLSELSAEEKEALRGASETNRNRINHP